MPAHGQHAAGTSRAYGPGRLENHPGHIGQTILQIPFQETIDVSTLPEGCYFITITTPQKRKLYSKFVKY